MGRLADSLLLSKSGVTRLVDRLVDDGLVERTSCSSDARGAEASLTGTGLARLRAAAPTHLAGIHDHFYAAINGDDMVVVGRAMSAVAARLCASAGPCDHGVEGTIAEPNGSGRGAETVAAASSQATATRSSARA